MYTQRSCLRDEWVANSAPQIARTSPPLRLSTCTYVDVNIMGGGYSKPKEFKSLHYPGYFASMPSMAGKVVAITGCTTGTGLVAAKAVAAKGGD